MFRPSIIKHSELYELPRPITRFRIQDRFDSVRFKVPLLPGDINTGFSRNGVDILIDGEIAMTADELHLTEAEMLLQLEELRELVSLTSDIDQYVLAITRDDASVPVSCFRGCSTSRLECDLSNPHLYVYSLVIHADDPVLYESVAD